ncbi:MAG: hypothetical protein OXB88_02665 [Bacteriovoracales bacterium]|nr:hypothetical protein [Bacteriovoracales bacterium]
MNVHILNPDDIRESVPIELTIENPKGKPVVYVEGLGSVNVTGQDGKYKARFWTMEKGNYKITVTDLDQKWEKNLLVKKQEYLAFRHEFGFFLLCLMMASLGVILWTKKLKKTKT